MTEGSRESLPMSGADKVENLAASWLERREREGWGEKQRAEFSDWLSQSPTHAVAFLRIEDVWARAERLRALGGSVQRDESAAENKTGWNIFLRVAASLVVLAAIVSGATAYFSAGHYQTYVTTIGGHEKLSLSDGSAIDLNTDTVLRISDDNRQRRIWLDRGEAYFDIRHNQANPLVVLVAGHRVTDIGTRFVIRSDPGRLEIRLMEGRARFESLDDHGRRSQLLGPGDVAITQAGLTTLVKRSAQDLASELGWQRGMLIFHHTTLADAAAEFNRYSRRTILIADAHAARASIDGTLPVGDLQEFTRMARNFFDLRPEKRGDTIVFIR